MPITHWNLEVYNLWLRNLVIDVPVNLAMESWPLRWHSLSHPQLWSQVVCYGQQKNETLRHCHSCCFTACMQLHYSAIYLLLKRTEVLCITLPPCMWVALLSSPSHVQIVLLYRWYRRNISLIFNTFALSSPQLCLSVSGITFSRESIVNNHTSDM